MFISIYIISSINIRLDSKLNYKYQEHCNIPEGISSFVEVTDMIDELSDVIEDFSEILQDITLLLSQSGDLGISCVGCIGLKSLSLSLF